MRFAVAVWNDEYEFRNKLAGSSVDGGNCCDGGATTTSFALSVMESNKMMYSISSHKKI